MIFDLHLSKQTQRDMKDLQKQTEDYQHSYIIKWVLIAVLFFTIVFGSIINGYSQTKEEVYNYCIEIGIQNPNFVTAQTQLETGYYNPNSLGMRNNNLLCFKWGTFLEFSHWKESLDYYKRWMNRKGIYYYKDLSTLLINEWGAGSMVEYINKVEWIKRNK